MKIAWEYELPTYENSEDYQYESPILVNGDYIYLVSDCIHDKKLHFINRITGAGTNVSIKSVRMQPSSYFAFSHGSISVFYAGNLYFILEDKIIKNIKLSQVGLVRSYLRKEDCLYVSCHKNRKVQLISIDLNKMDILWSIDITNTKPYIEGALSHFDSIISCYGRDKLLFVDPNSGEILDEIKISRIDKLFCPIRVDEDSLLIGYTNWTIAGILKYQISTKKVLWRHKRKFDGPHPRSKIYMHDDKVFWIKMDTELIALDCNTGIELFNNSSRPCWFYSDLDFIHNGVLFGTAGADGYLYYIDYKTGNKIWSHFMKNGCAYYDIYLDSILTGDFNKSLKRIQISDGSIVDELSLDAEVIGQIRVANECLYTVIWGNENKNVRLIKVKL